MHIAKWTIQYTSSQRRIRLRTKQNLKGSHQTSAMMNAQTGPDFFTNDQVIYIIGYWYHLLVPSPNEVINLNIGTKLPE